MMTQFKKSLRVVLFGATGLVGREVLTQLENNPQIFKIDVIGRRSVETSSPKTKFHFSDLKSVKNILNFPADIALCCLGTTMAKAKSKEAFRHVDHDLVLNVARACSSVGITTFGVISSIGASMNALSFYLKIKAEMEESLQKLSFDHLVILRPSLLLGERIEIRHLEKFSQKFSTFISPLFVGPLKRYRFVKASSVARCLIETSQKPIRGISFIENSEIIKSDLSLSI